MNEDQHPRPSVQIAAAVLRRRNPRQWPKKGVPGIFQDYAALYDVLMLTDKRKETLLSDPQNAVHALPKAKLVSQEDPCQTAMKAWDLIKPKRAELIDAVSTGNRGQVSLLMFMPVDKSFESGDNSFVDTSTWTEAAWIPLSSVLQSLRPYHRAAYRMSSSTKKQIAALEEWLSDTHTLPEVVAMLWSASAQHRIRSKQANPLFTTKQRDADSRKPAVVIRNPIFGSGLVLFKAGTDFTRMDAGQLGDGVEVADMSLDMLDDEDNTPLTPARHSAALQAVRDLEESSPPASPTTGRRSVWGEDFPVHRASMTGDEGRVRELIKAGYPAAEHDDDSWTPLHYAAWHGHAGVVRVLMQDWQGLPTERTDNGATALHFAARNGHPEVVTILLACPIVDPVAQDKDGKTPLNLAQKLQQGKWVEVAKILKNPNTQNAVNRFARIESFNPGDAADFRIFLMDGSEKVIRLPGGDVTTALDLRDGIAGMCNIPEEFFRLFAIWIASPSLTVQLEDDMKPLRRLNRWPQMLELYAEQSAWGEKPVLVFRRNRMLSLSDERRVKSPVAMKFLFDEALVNFTNSFWPCTVDQSVHLAGLLMQIRFGAHDPQRHKVGFLQGGLDTFVPQHLMHNQLKSAEWERRIYKTHQQYSENTDIHILHRLFLQYCWQWPFYGATFFDVDLQRHTKRLMGGTRHDVMRVGINTEWCTLIHADTNTLRAAISMDQLTYTIDNTNMMLECSDPAQVRDLQAHLKPGAHVDTLVATSRQAFLAGMLFKSITEQRGREERLRQQQRVAQGGPLVLRIRQEESTAPEVPEDLEQHERKINNEKQLRWKFMHSFGELGAEADMCAAHAHFMNRNTTEDGYVPIKDIKNVFAEFGYWLGAELDFARLSLNATGENVFNFRDVVSWWCQSKRSWLMLLDDSAFKERQLCSSIFLRNDPQRTGKVSGDKMMGVIRGLRSANLTKKTEAACQQGMDPHKTGEVHFNDYIDWLAHMHIISDRKR